MFGQMTDVNVWVRSLSSQEVEAWSDCQLGHQGLGKDQVVQWDSAKITSSQGLLEKTMDKAKFCKPIPSQLIRKASLFFGGRSEKRLGRSSPPQNGGIGGTMAL